MKTSHKNQKGFSHDFLLPVLVIVVVGAIGTYLLHGSNAMSNDVNSQKPFRIATFNILSSKIAPKFWTERADKSIKVIRGETPMGRFDIVGVQEMKLEQRLYFEKRLPQYGAYPKNPSSDMTHLTIFWNKRAFELRDQGSINYIYYGDLGLYPGHRAPWVKLHDKASGKPFYVLNLHNVVRTYAGDAGGKTAAQKRERTAQLVRQWVADTRHNTRLPVFVLGDFNSAYVLRKGDTGVGRRNLPYCILGSDSLMRNTRDTFKKRRGNCPSKEPGNFIDHVYASADVNVKRWAHPTARQYKIKSGGVGSDHTPVFADILFNNSEANLVLSPEKYRVMDDIQPPTARTSTNIPELEDAGQAVSENPATSQK